MSGELFLVAGLGLAPTGLVDAVVIHFQYLRSENWKRLPLGEYERRNCIAKPIILCHKIMNL